MLKALFILGLTIFISPISEAYFIAVPNAEAIDYGKTTRILLSGRGTDLGTQPQLTALGRALLYQRNFPEHQIVLISVFENPRNEANLIRAGWTIVKKNDVNLETRAAVAEIRKFKRIRSFELFGHNSPSIGTQTDGPGMRFDPSDPIVDQLAPLFDAESYVIFHGCNSGWIIAQNLSKRWKTAVAGSMTGTRFEHLHSDGHFYVFDNKKAPSPDWARRNDDIGVNTCAGGGCIRMKPAYAAYMGKWGDFSGPLLNHYKFFCQLDEAICEKRMAQAMFGFLAERSLTRQATAHEFADVVKQYLCPVYKDRVITENCLNELDKIERGQGNPQIHYVFGAPQLACDLRSCTGKMTCVDHTCTISGRVSKGSTTLTQEYLHFLKGFELLKADGF